MVSIFHLSCAGTPIGCRWPGPGPSQAQAALTYHNLVNGTKCLNVSLWPHVPWRSGQLGSFSVLLQQCLKWAKSLNMKWVTMTRKTAELCSKCMAPFCLWINHAHTHTIARVDGRPAANVEEKEARTQLWNEGCWGGSNDIEWLMFDQVALTFLAIPLRAARHHDCGNTSIMGNLFLSIGCIPKSRTAIWARLWRFSLSLSHHFKLKQGTRYASKFVDCSK